MSSLPQYGSLEERQFCLSAPQMKNRKMLAPSFRIAVIVFDWSTELVRLLHPAEEYNS